MPRKDNIEVVTEMMTFPNSGPLMQAFVMQALTTFAHCVVNSPKGYMGDNPMVSEDAWRACAEEVETTLAKHFGRTPS